MLGNKNYNTKPTNIFQYKKNKSCLDNELDEFGRELLKHDINVQKWYHKLLMGNYYNKLGDVYHDDPIVKKLAYEYNKAYLSQNVDTLLLIKNELMNHIPEQVWIHKFLSGEIYDKDGNQLNNTTHELKNVSSQYLKAYSDAVETL
jgi:hypothetical protein